MTEKKALKNDEATKAELSAIAHEVAS